MDYTGGGFAGNFYDIFSDKIVHVCIFYFT